MKKSLFFVLCSVVVVGLFLAGCGEKKIAEKVTENILEKATNGAADVDMDDDTITVNTNAGSWTAGENVSLPSGFPSDVHVIDGTIKMATTVKENESYSVSLETDESVAQVKSEYEEELAADGWTSSLSMTINGSASLGYQKDNRTVSVIIAATEEGKTMVSISVAVTDDSFSE